MRRTPAPTILTVVAVLSMISVPAASQQDLPSTCFNCDFNVNAVDWNGTADPGGIANGTFTITNSGETEDSYDITVAMDNESWTAEVEPTTITELSPGSGVFAAEDNQATFVVRVLVPQGAEADAESTVTITVQSQGDQDLNKTLERPATARQVYGWTLTCTDRVEIQKSKDAKIELTAKNTGNGPDRAELTVIAPPAGIVTTDVDPVDPDPGDSDVRTSDVGVGLRVEDGDYTLRWEARSTTGSTAVGSCESVVVVSGGGGGGNGGGGGEDNESPAGSILVVVAVAVAAAAFLRRRAPQ